MAELRESCTHRAKRIKKEPGKKAGPPARKIKE